MKMHLGPITAILAFFLACAQGFPAFSQTESPRQRSITVSGEAREEVAPDQGMITVTLTDRAKDIEIAKGNNDKMAHQVAEAVVSAGIPKEKIATAYMNVSPEYNYDHGKQQFIGYMVNRALRITVKPVDKQEKLVSGLIKLGIDQVSGMEFQLSDPETHAARVRVKAFENARARAEALAKAAGGALGPALTISTVSSPPMMPPIMPMMTKAMAMEGAADSVAPTLPGLIALQESVTVTFALE